VDRGIGLPFTALHRRVSRHRARKYISRITTPVQPPRLSAVGWNPRGLGGAHEFLFVSPAPQSRSLLRLAGCGTSRGIPGSVLADYGDRNRSLPAPTRRAGASERDPFHARFAASVTRWTTSSEYCVRWHDIERRAASKSAFVNATRTLKYLACGIKRGARLAPGSWHACPRLEGMRKRDARAGPVPPREQAV
jgi:hypothetical protein